MYLNYLKIQHFSNITVHITKTNILLHALTHLVLGLGKKPKPNTKPKIRKSQADPIKEKS